MAVWRVVGSLEIFCKCDIAGAFLFRIGDRNRKSSVFSGA